MIEYDTTIDFDALVAEATMKVRVEVDRKLAYECAVQMRRMGWVCIPPAEDRPGVEVEGAA